MGRFINSATSVVVSVADEKDDRFGAGWEPYDGTEPEVAAVVQLPDGTVLGADGEIPTLPAAPEEPEPAEKPKPGARSSK